MAASAPQAGSLRYASCDIDGTWLTQMLVLKADSDITDAAALRVRLLLCIFSESVRKHWQ